MTTSKSWDGDKMPSKALIERLNQRAACALKQDRCTAGKNTLALNPPCYIVLADDGLNTHKIVFQEPPTLAQLAERTPPNSWIISVKPTRLSYHWNSFPTLRHARQLIAAWRDDYNHRCSHTSLDGLTPRDYH
ncbi:hypothetical protein EU800_25640 [Tropicimonas sp. IMCC6043]|nr:hypothetical protein EU800_25640 [Tropicimonas sp. IMCC6043]